MNRKYLATGAVLALTIGSISVSCTSAQKKEMTTVESDNDSVLFTDPMSDNWQESWFLDGKEATVEHRDGGLYFSAGTITKSMDREKYHAHHAVLWTKQEFEGDIDISYELTRVDDSTYGTTLLYIQAQGIGVPPYVKDIYAWRELREKPAMALYFKYMSLVSLSFRENLRCKRYPWFDVEKDVRFDPLIDPMVDYERMEPGKTYQVEVEKRKRSLTLRLFRKEDSKCLRRTSGPALLRKAVSVCVICRPDNSSIAISR